jgi:hypothetical protein
MKSNTRRPGHACYGKQFKETYALHCPRCGFVKFGGSDHLRERIRRVSAEHTPASPQRARQRDGPIASRSRSTYTRPARRNSGSHAGCQPPVP